MSMTVVIADDDVLILGKLNMLFSENANYTVLASATTGEDAVKAIEKYHPDLLVADVEMPAPTGIEIIRYIKKNKLKTEVLILSNHNNFDYVRDALKEGALDYVLKDQLTEGLFTLKLKELLKMIETKHSDETDKIGFSRYVKQRFLLSCLSGNSEEPANGQIWMEEKEYKSGAHSIVRLQLVDVVALYEKKDFLIRQVTNVIDSILQRVGEGLCVYVGNGAFVILFSFGSYIGHANAIAEIRKIITLIESNLLKIFNLEIFHTFDIFHDAITNISKYNQHCKERIDEKLLDKEPDKKEKGDSYVFRFRDELAIINAFYHSDAGEVAEILEQVYDYAVNFGMEGVIEASLELCKIGEKAKEQAGMFSYDAAPSVSFPKIKGKNLIEELKRYFIARCNQLIELNSKKSENPARSPHVAEAINYIHQNYDKELSLDTMAEHLHISNVYFSRLFKAETGIAFSNYLCQYRISVAKELLKNTNASIMEITQKIGFQNYNYFIQVFKKMVGTTPLKYRSS